MDGSSVAKGRRTMFGSRSWKAFRSAIALVLAVAFVPLVPASAFAAGATGPLTVEGSSVYANGAPVTITDNTTAGIDISWEAGTYGGVAYEKGSYNYTFDDAVVFAGAKDAAVDRGSVSLQAAPSTPYTEAAGRRTKPTPRTSTRRA